MPVDADTYTELNTDNYHAANGNAGRGFKFGIVELQRLRPKSASSGRPWGIGSTSSPEFASVSRPHWLISSCT